MAPSAPSEDTTAPSQSVSPFLEVGLSGLKRSSGFVHEEFLPALVGRKGMSVLREMNDNDSMCGAIIFAVDSLIRQAKWRAEAPQDAPTDTEDARVFLSECMDDMSHPFGDFVSEALTMLPFGWAWHEIVYKRRVGPEEKDGSRRSKFTDGRIGWRKIPLRAQDSLLRWEFDKSGGIQGFWQQCAPDYVPQYIPIEKSLLFRTSHARNNPEGRSIFRNAYRSWYYKKRIEEIEAVGIERDLAGFPVMYVDPQIMKSDAPSEKKAAYEAYKEIVVNIRRDQQEGLILPTVIDPDTRQRLYELVLLTSGGARQFNTNETINRYEQRIAMTVMADFILLGHEKVGSFALSSDKTDLFATALGAWMNEIKNVINTHLVPRLFRLNGIDVEVKPEITFGDIEIPSLAEIGTYIQTLVAAGARLFPNDRLEDHLLDLGKLPKPTEQERTEMEEAKQEAKEEMQRAFTEGQGQEV